MKRTLAIILVISMLVCMLPAFSLGITAAEDDEVNISGLNATLYQLKGLDTEFEWNVGLLDDIIPNASTGHDCSFNDSLWFDESIDQMLKISKVVDEFSGTKHTGFDLLDKNGYYLKFTGTIKAENPGTYYFNAHIIDNGFVAFIDQNGDGVFDRETEKFYEYWTNHWFDAAGSSLVWDKGFTLEAGKETAVEFWYLEMEGGDALDINVSTNADGSGDVEFADAGLELDLTRTCYISNNVINHDRIYAVLPEGVRGGACADAGHINEGTHNDGNCSSAAVAGNQLYTDTIEAIKAEMMNLGTIKLANFEKSTFAAAELLRYGWRYEDSMIVYEGYMTPSVDGKYQFGTTSVDNGLVIEIQINNEWVRVYEFWASKVWNDRTATYYQKDGQDVTVDLEKDVAYPIRATYLEIDGGEGLTTVVKVDGEQKGLTEVVAFTTEKPTAPVKPAIINLFDSSKEWYYKTSGKGNEFQIRDDAWKTDSEVYGTWEKTTGTFDVWKGTADNPVDNQSIWAVTTFTVEDLDAIEGYELMMSINYDDNIRMYVNGKLVNIELGWNEGGAATWSLAEEATDLLVEGTNTIAMKLVQGWGGFSVGVESLYLSLDENNNAPYEFKYTDKDGAKQSGVITTADQWLAYVADANARGNANKDDRIMIAADLDFTGKTWVPLNNYIGRIYGEYHTFKNITYTATVDGTAGTDGGVAAGLFVNSLTNDVATGHIENLTFENCKLTVNATVGEGKEKSVIVGIVAGIVDRGRIENVTVKGSTIDGNATAAGAVAGVASFNYDQNGVHVENCAVIDTTVTATSVAGGVLAYVRGDNTVRLGNVYAEDVTLNAPQSGLAYGSFWGWAGENVVLHSTTVKGENTVSSILAADEEEDYKFYYQTRPGADGTTDYRIICVANKAWATSQASIKVSISFFEGSVEKSTVATATTVYEKLKAESEGLTEIFTSDEESVIFGWVVKGVPAEFLEEEPFVELDS